MELKSRNQLIYGLLLVAWLLVVGWQVQEHFRITNAARNDLRNRSKEIANTISAFIRGLNFRGTVLQERLEPVLNELVNGRSNELVTSSELISIALLNTNGEPVVEAGQPVDPEQAEILQEGERWGRHTVTFLNPVEGAAIVVLPPRRDFTNSFPDGGQMRRRRMDDGSGAPLNSPNLTTQSQERGSMVTETFTSSNTFTNETVARSDRFRERRSGPWRPPWMRGMDEKYFEALIQKNELHGLVLAMSTDTVQAAALHDLWLRFVIAFFAGISAIGVCFAWGNLARSSELEIRLVRASELNTHLRQMNLAAAGLAHETRNPLNIVRGLAQMISRRPDAASEIQAKAREIIDETDKVTVQLNEFINYSRPREVRRTVLPLNAAVNEVVHALNYDIEEKKVRVGVTGEPLSIEADEQLLRQALFNLVLNAVQAVNGNGEIEIRASRDNASEAALEIRDNGPGVPPERREEIFKPYFTTNQKGTGLGLAVVQQIVLAHGWEIICLPNQPQGAVFRITHLKLAA